MPISLKETDQDIAHKARKIYLVFGLTASIAFGAIVLSAIVANDVAAESIFLIGCVLYCLGSILLFRGIGASRIAVAWVCVALLAFIVGETVDLIDEFSALDHLPIIGGKAPYSELIEEVMRAFGVIGVTAAYFLVAMGHRVSRLHLEARQALLKTEVSRREDAEQALVHSENTLRQVIDLVPHSIYAKDDEGRFLFVNKRSAELMGTTPIDAVGKTQTDLTRNPREAYALLAEDERVLRTGAILANQTHVYTDAAGVEHIEETIKIPYVPYGSDRKAVLGISVDISDRIEMLAALRASEERHRLLVENISDVIIMLNDQAQIEYSSPAVATTLGFEPGENWGISVLNFVHPDDQDRVRSIMESILSSDGQNALIACRVRRKDGQYSEISAIIKSFRGPEGQRKVVIVYRDVTAERRAERERELLEEQLNQSRKMEAVGQLAGGVAHDFNNLLQALNGFTELAMGHLPDNLTQPRQYLQEAAKASDRARLLVEQLLTFSRREVTRPEDIDIAELIRSTMALVGRTLGEHIEIETVFPEESLLVRADPTQLQLVVMNLCFNARDAMPEGGQLHLAARIEHLTAEDCAEWAWVSPGNFVQVSVSDTGTGMADSLIDHIFEPFFTTKEVGSGTGLGLATAYGVVRKLHGFIGVTSALGKGSEFTVHLPTLEPASTDGPSRADSEDASCVLASDDPGQPPRCIFLAEDDELVRKFTVQVLEKVSYTVIVAKDGQEAIDLFEANMDQIDLCVLDVVMPKRNGHQVFEHIRNRIPGMPVLFVTGYGYEVLRDGLLPAGEHELLKKPYRPTQFLQKIREMLSLA